MTKVIGIRLHGRGKAYHFDPADLKLCQGMAVIVETAQGIEMGICSGEMIDLPAEQIKYQLKPVVRIATTADLERFEANQRLEEEAYAIAREKIERHGLDMRLVDVEYMFDNKRIVFYFTAEGRIDFRELVKDLASVFRTRIELRQIGVRDEARLIGGLGICGRELCCCSFLRDFVPVSIKMAKEQNLSMNPAKISGACGRLLCCLKYEQDAYEDARKRLPQKGNRVQTPQGVGTVIQVNLLKETVDVRLESGDAAETVSFRLSELESLRPRGGCGGSRCPKEREK